MMVIMETFAYSSAKKTYKNSTSNRFRLIGFAHTFQFRKVFTYQMRQEQQMCYSTVESSCGFEKLKSTIELH